ncbi:GTP-binding protein [Sporolactobacillus pectinivorans]|uniref:GTP-binding protein n=1 Tax=Sporolactobacillus pectinivorans TaxID=1591408 RepID=UPI000C263A6A|nr:GTP-binding protein [Sporolactobacillus pectinivorans]
MAKKIPVTILSGYLGSGKTTILNYILHNRQGLKVAVIVNDLGEVNIDAALIEQAGGLSKTDEKLVQMSNGCICCTLRTDLLIELDHLAKEGRFDYVLIESTGIGEPVPVAQTFSYVDQESGIDLTRSCCLDTMVTVVDAYRFMVNFQSGDSLVDRKQGIGEHDDRQIADLLIDQIEFCDVLIINKCDLVSERTLSKLEHVIRILQPEARIIRTVQGKVDPKEILNTSLFNYQKAIIAAGWIQELTNGTDHHTSETEEYGISSFVYARRYPFHTGRLNRFLNDLPENIVQAKGIAWCATRNSTAMLLSQAGPSVSLEPVTYWVASLPIQEQKQILSSHPEVLQEWDNAYGDRHTKLVFIGTELEPHDIIEDLERCLLTESEFNSNWSKLEESF